MRKRQCKLVEPCEFCGFEHEPVCGETQFVDFHLLVRRTLEPDLAADPGEPLFIVWNTEFNSVLKYGLKMRLSPKLAPIILVCGGFKGICLILGGDDSVRRLS